MSLTEYLWFAFAILATLIYNTLLAAYCFRLKASFPEEWDALGQPLPIRSSGRMGAMNALFFRILRGKCAGIGDRRQAQLAWWVRLTFMLSAILVVPFFFFVACAIFSGAGRAH